MTAFANTSADSRQDVTTAALTSIAAWLLFGAGLMAPLTPSEGRPGIVALAVCVAAPAVLLFWVGLKGVTRFVRVAGWLQLALLAWFAWVVLSVVFESPNP
jgi:hypothetical protein